MKISLNIDESLWKNITSSGKDNERSTSGEIRFQLNKIYRDKK